MYKNCGKCIKTYRAQKTIVLDTLQTIVSKIMSKNVYGYTLSQPPGLTVQVVIYKAKAREH